MRQYVRHFSEILQFANLEKANAKRVAFHDADFGRTLGLSRIGIHHIVIPPNFRSSLPHAESHEEEFVYVLSGHPQAWINGDLFQLVNQDILAFPAGTGICHTVINNTEEDVHLLVVGERTKIENVCVFPLNSEMKNESNIWWENAPNVQIGNHDGLPQILSKSKYELKTFRERPQLICNLIEIPQQNSLPYPGDQEIFSLGRRISKTLGLKNLGIWHETLSPGHRTSWPHAHMREEEFVYVLKGQPQVWIHGNLQQLGAGEGVAFPAGTGLAHTILNNSDQNCELIVVGESGLENDRIYYPLHPKRNEQCRAHGWLWENHPQIEIGKDSSEPRRKKVFQQELI